MRTIQTRGAGIMTVGAATLVLFGVLLSRPWPAAGQDHDGTKAAALPKGVQAVWDLDKAFHETTATRERLSINGLWRWQPADAPSDQVPAGGWGYFKVPGAWPGITDYMQKDSQTVHAHPNWKDTRLGSVTAAWYQREMAIPAGWSGRRITVCAEYVNSYAAVYVDGRKAARCASPSAKWT